VPGRSLLLRGEERDPRAGERKASIETAAVRNVLAELRAEHVERGEARIAKTVVGHRDDDPRTISNPSRR
jgi:hypothetical protein